MNIPANEPLLWSNTDMIAFVIVAVVVSILATLTVVRLIREEGEEGEISPLNLDREFYDEPEPWTPAMEAKARKNFEQFNQHQPQTGKTS